MRHTFVALTLRRLREKASLGYLGGFYLRKREDKMCWGPAGAVEGGGWRVREVHLWLLRELEACLDNVRL